MALVLFGVLLLFGVTGVERRRGLMFSAITGLLLFALALPFIIQDASSSGVLYAAGQAGALLTAFVLVSTLSYFAGWCGHLLLERTNSNRSR